MQTRLFFSKYPLIKRKLCFSYSFRSLIVIKSSEWLIIQLNKWCLSVQKYFSANCRGICSKSKSAEMYALEVNQIYGFLWYHNPRAMWVWPRLFLGDGPYYNLIKPVRTWTQIILLAISEGSQSLFPKAYHWLLDSKILYYDLQS